LAVTSQELSSVTTAKFIQPAEARVVAHRAQLAVWLVTPFFTGAVIMALELVGFRLYAPYFGYSIYVWGGMISVVMVALALEIIPPHT
jgi:hypothetical protein